MTRKEALQELLVKVRADAGWLDVDNAAAMSFKPESSGGPCTFHNVGKAYNGSMDAALSLFDAVLPGWTYGLNVDANNEKYAFVSFGTYETDECYSDVHSRALLIATLEALVGMEDG